MRQLAALAVFALSGCADFTSPDASEVGQYPTNYRAIVAAAVRAEFFDPSSLQDVFVSTPFPARWEFTKGWGVCLRANGKNRMGGYSGQHEYGYLIQDGRIVVEGDYKGCDTAQYVEWPELENMGWKR